MPVTVPASPPVGVVQGWVSEETLEKLRDVPDSLVFVYSGQNDRASRTPVAIVSLALDASGQRVVPEELVERCAEMACDAIAHYRQESRLSGRPVTIDDDRALTRAVLQAAFVPAAAPQQEDRR